MPISRRQALTLADMVHTKEGFSVYVDDAGDLGDSVRKVTDSYMVGGQAPSVSHDAPIQPEAIQGYAASRPELQHPSNAMGAWHDTARHPAPQVDLDVSRSFPRTQEGSRAARRETLAKDEIAYGELDTEGEYAGSHNNPFSTRVMARTPDKADYLSPKAAASRGAHFRAGITSESLGLLLQGDRPAAKEAWIHGDRSTT